MMIFRSEEITIVQDAEILSKYQVLIFSQRLQLQYPPLNWITNNWISRLLLSEIYTLTVHKTCHLIESFGYYYHFYAGPKWFY